MIPNALKILQLLGSAIKVIFIIMFLLTSVKSESACIAKSVRAYAFYHPISHGYLAVINGTVGIACEKHTLYTITVYMKPSDQLDHRKSSKFFIFDPAAKQFICLMNKKKHRFVAKRNLKPEDLCLFLEEPSDYRVQYIVEFNRGASYPLKFSKSGKLMRPTQKTKQRGNDLFIRQSDESECDNVEENFCNNLIKGRHRKQSQTIRNICWRN